MLLIYSNTGVWGGVDMLIAGFARYLESQGKAFKIVEPSGSRLRSQVANEHFIECDDVATVAHRVTRVFFPSISKIGDPRFPWSEIPDAKVFAWIVHPNDLFLRYFPYSGKALRLFGHHSAVILRWLFRKHYALLSRMIKTLVENRAVATMDGATTRSLHFFIPELSVSPPIVPIPSCPMDLTPTRKTGRVLKIGYLGRLDAMKWSALQPFLKHSLAPVLERRPVEMHAITEGACIGELEKMCAGLGIPLELRGYLPNDEARRWLSERCDVAVAMGTSALDLAGVGIPAVVLDPALKRFTPRQKRFRFIHDSPDFTLGEYRDFPGYVPGRKCFSDLCEANELIKASATGRMYVRSSHDPGECYKQLDSLISASGLAAADLQWLAQDLVASLGATKSHPLRALFGVARG